MPLFQSRPTVRFAARPVGLCLGAALVLAAGCTREDVGAPCNHGQVDPPESELVTFPALSCNDLLCVYADKERPPDRSCSSDSECNLNEGAVRQKFACVDNECKLRVDYVLERSMCSKKCNSDSDCANEGTKKVVVDNTECASGFKCARIQSLGQFCCQKLCVCRDDLPVTDELDQQCSSNSQEQCCVINGELVMPQPEGCGVP